MLKNLFTLKKNKKTGRVKTNSTDPKRRTTIETDRRPTHAVVLSRSISSPLLRQPEDQMKLWEKFHQDFNVVSFIDKGATGRVFRCKVKSNDKDCAVKVQRYRFQPSSYFEKKHMLKQIRTEAQVQEGLAHENIAKVFHHWEETSMSTLDESRHEHDPLLLTQGDDQDMTHEALEGSSIRQQEYTSESDSFGRLGFSLAADAESSLDETSPPKSATTMCCVIDHFIQMSFYENTLKTWLIDRTCIDFDQTVDFVRQLCRGIEYIHDKGLVHRDIKPANVFIHKNSTIKVGDFGLSKAVIFKDDSYLPQMKNNQANNTTGVGTPPYASPEQTHGKLCHASSDMYSLGIVIFEMFSMFGTIMGKSRAIDDLCRHRKLPQSFKTNPPIIVQLVLDLTNPAPDERPSCTEVLKSLNQLIAVEDKELGSSSLVEDLDQALLSNDRTSLELERLESLIDKGKHGQIIEKLKTESNFQRQLLLKMQRQIVEN